MKGILPIIFILASAILGFFYVMPAYDELRMIQETESRIDGALETARSINEIGDKLSSDMASISSASIARLERLLPDSVDGVRFLDLVNDIVIRNGMEVQNIKIKNDGKDKEEEVTTGRSLVSTPEVRAVTVNFSVTTDYNTLLALLADLERSLVLIDVDALSFSAKEEALEGSTYEIDLRTYWFK